MEKNQYDIPLTLPGNAQDRFEYPLKYIIQVVVSFEQTLDDNILAKAVRLSLDAEPVLGCRFVENDPQPYWERFENLDGMQWFKCISTDNTHNAVESILKSPFFQEGQQINIALVHAPGGDTLVVKVSHASSDAGGLKQYLDLLAGIYSELQKNHEYRPSPNTGNRRDQKYYFDALGISDPLACFDPQAPVPFPEWSFPYHGTETKDMHMTLRRFKGEDFERIMRCARQQGVTVTSILLTAMFRSMFALLQPSPGEERGITVSFDLRNAMPKRTEQAVCNLSVGIRPRISRQEGESFDATLNRVSAALEQLKHNKAESTDAIALEAWATMDWSAFVSQIQAILQWSAETGRSDPLLSNIGVIEPLHFGSCLATDVYLLTPVVIPPAFMIAVTTYQRTLTLQCTFGEPGHRRDEVERFMDLMKQELSSL